jgi:hypothetical protein
MSHGGVILRTPADLEILSRKLWHVKHEIFHLHSTLRTLESQKANILAKKNKLELESACLRRLQVDILNCIKLKGVSLKFL